MPVAFKNFDHGTYEMSQPESNQFTEIKCDIFMSCKTE